MTDYKTKLWHEIAVNDPIMAKALAAAKPFNPTLSWPGYWRSDCV